MDGKLGVALTLFLMGGLLVAIPNLDPSLLSVAVGPGGGCTSGVTITSLTPSQVSGVGCAVNSSASQSGNPVYVWVTDGSGSTVFSKSTTTGTAGFFSLPLSLGQGSSLVAASLCPQSSQPCSTQNAVASFTYVSGTSTTTFTESIGSTLNCPTGYSDVAGACVQQPTSTTSTSTTSSGTGSLTLNLLSELAGIGLMLAGGVVLAVREGE